MVCYCCVKGCKNNSNIKKKDVNSIISFHAFPSNPELKTKWLKAIGRPNWEPPMHTRICSVHFHYDQISHEGCRTRIKDDACPINFLPLNSNFEASFLKVCRICLASEVKMYSLKNEIFNTCFETIVGLNTNHIEGLPQFVCYECGACLLRCYHLIEKSMISQATLLDIFAQNGKLTMCLIKKQDRKQLNLRSSLSFSKTINNYIYFYDTGDEISSQGNDGLLPNYDSAEGLNISTKHFTLRNESTNDIGDDTLQLNDFNKTKNEELTPVTDKMSFYFDDDHLNFDEKDCMSLHEAISSDVNAFDDDDAQLKSKINAIPIHNKIEKRSPTKVNRKRINGLTPSEVEMQKHFSIVTLTPQEQFEEWKRTATKRPLTGETIFECKICMKTFAHIKTYQLHIASHSLSRGPEECPVCKLRFKSDVHMRSHQNRAHGKKFCCKKCPKVFNNVGVAKMHHRWHCGHEYRCDVCPFKSVHESALGVHARSAHAHGSHACARCGVPCVSMRGLALHTATMHRDQPDVEVSSKYRCESCNVNFVSEGARRVHLLTGHKKSPLLCDTTDDGDTIRKTCKRCGQEFPCLNDLVAHMKAEHRMGPRKKTSWKMPGDSYPAVCEHCDKTVNSRKEHWWHVRQQHPRERHLYRPVVTAVCDVCGKGFQNSTKLHLHELRHGRPTVKCGHCPRLFYDKYAAARHSSIHQQTKPHTCRLCGRAFRFKGNLLRHSRVHTGVTPYECPMCEKKFKHSTSVNLHVRTVHHKLPHPPRKKRTKPRVNSPHIYNT